MAVSKVCAESRVNGWVPVEREEELVIVHIRRDRLGIRPSALVEELVRDLLVLVLVEALHILGIARAANAIMQIEHKITDSWWQREIYRFIFFATHSFC